MRLVDVWTDKRSWVSERAATRRLVHGTCSAPADAG